MEAMCIVATLCAVKMEFVKKITSKQRPRKRARMTSNFKFKFNGKIQVRRFEWTRFRLFPFIV